MENNIFYSAGLVALIYILVKFIEMRVIIKENRPLKDLVKDSLVVYFCTVAGFYCLDYFQPLTENITEKVTAFTSPPDF